MLSGRPRHENHNEIIFERIRKASCRAVRTLVSEITGNYRRVCQLTASLFVFCSSYIFSFKCRIQSVLQSIEAEAKYCETNLVYHTPVYSRLKDALYSALQTTSSVRHTGCICCTAPVRAYDVECLTLWLRRRKFRLSLDDSSQWDDGILMYTILHRVSTSGNDAKFEKLDPSRKVQNWSLNISLLNSWYPGLIQNRLLLHCITSSGSVNPLHVVEILTRLMHARRRVWRGRWLRWILHATNAVDGILKPWISLSGPGMVYAKLNMRNELVIKSKFPCPAFTIEFESENGELWRETSACARLNSAQEGEYDRSYSSSGEGEIPLEIIRVSKYHYRIFYTPRLRATYKISVKPGIGKGGHVYGSPFYVQAQPASYWRESISLSTRKVDRTPSTGAQLSRLRSLAGVLATSLAEPTIPEEQSHYLLNNLNGFANTARGDPDLSSEEDPLSCKTQRRNQGRVASVFRFMKTRLLSVSDRLRSYRRDSTPTKMSDVIAKRRTYASVGSQKSSLLGGAGSKDLSVPSSRNLKIRRVTIHRYLNEPMPSLEKYLFGQGGFTVENDESGDKTDALKRWSNISALLRAKIRMMNKNITEEEEEEKAPQKGRKYGAENGNRRRLRLRASADTYRMRRPVRRTSSDIFARMNSGYDSSSSSESGYDANDTDSNDVESENATTFDISKNPSRDRSIPSQENEETPKRRTTSFPDVPRFEHIFSNQGWLTDIFLDESLPRKHRASFLLDGELKPGSVIKPQNGGNGLAKINDRDLRFGSERGSQTLLDRAIDNARDGERSTDRANVPRTQTIDDRPRPAARSNAERKAKPDNKEALKLYAQRLSDSILQSAYVEFRRQSSLQTQPEVRKSSILPHVFTRKTSMLLHVGENGGGILEGGNRRMLCRK